LLLGEGRDQEEGSLDLCSDIVDIHLQITLSEELRPPGKPERALSFWGKRVAYSTKKARAVPKGD
jgi:hypothetical protein